MFRALALLCLPAVAIASPTTMGFDGRIVDTTGTPINGPVAVDIVLHSDPEVEAEVWTEDFDVVAVDGYFHVDLGRTLALPPVLAANGELWVEVKVGTVAMGPRTPLHGAAYSLTDADALSDLSCTAGQSIRWTGTAWACAADTLASLSCSPGDSVRWTGSAWTCAPDPVSALSCNTGDSVRWNGSAWECDPQPAITTFTCAAAAWSVGANAQICSTTVTPTVDSLVVTTANGHWQTGNESQWCIVEIQYPGEGSYYSPPSPYADRKGSAHGYPGTSWDGFSVTRAVPLAGGQTHTISLYVSEVANGSCTVNGASLHGWVIPQ